MKCNDSWLCEVMPQHLIWFKIRTWGSVCLLFSHALLDLLYLCLIYCTCVLWVMNSVLLQCFSDRRHMNKDFHSFSDCHDTDALINL